MAHSSRFRILASACAGLVLWVCLLPAQNEPSPGNTGSTGNTGGTGSVGGAGSVGGVGGTTPTTRTPTTPQMPGIQDQQQRFPEFQRPIFLSGKIMMDDGSPVPTNVVIERICNGRVIPEGYADSKGRFSVQLGQNSQMVVDASVGSTLDPVMGPGAMNSARGGFPSGGVLGGRSITERDLIGCELRASYPGYRSDVVQLTGRRFMDNPDVGTIVLHRLANVTGTTISFSSLNAPKDAKKALEKGLKEAQHSKWEKAVAELTKAVTIYPEYAEAWYNLGRVYTRMSDHAKAKEAFQKSIQADEKFISPYLSLATMATMNREWDEAVRLTEKICRLNPVEFPAAWLFNSIAQYNLQNLDAAEKSAREAVKLDTLHQFPKAQHVLGVVLAQKQDLTGAAANLKAYLQYAPQAGDAEIVKKQLAEIEEYLAQTQGAPQQPQPE